MSVGSATLNLLLTDNNTKVLQSPRIRATDAQKATMKIGSRIPIATGSYQTGAATALVSSLVNTQFQYQDVGVNIEMTPSIHYDHDVTLKIKIEVSAESGTETISGVTEPIISQRVVDQVIRLREGEASILGGIQNKQEENNWNGIPGLSAIPILKYIFGSKDHTIQDDDIVFVVVPHIVRSQELDQANLRVIDTGEGPVDRPAAHGPGNAAASPQSRPRCSQPRWSSRRWERARAERARGCARDAGAITRRYGVRWKSGSRAQAAVPPPSLPHGPRPRPTVAAAAALRCYRAPRRIAARRQFCAERAGSALSRSAPAASFQVPVSC